MKQRSSFRQLFGFLLICLLLLSFAACTDKGGEEGDDPTNTDPTGAIERTIAVYNGVSVSIEKYTDNDTVTATAEDISGKVFVCWNRNNSPYSFDKTFTYSVEENSVFKAVYSVYSYATADAGEGTLSISDKGTVVKSKTHSEKVTPTLRIAGTPEIVGIAAVGKTLTANLRPLSGSCTSYLYRWQRADLPTEEYTDIEGATSETYTLTEADAGRYVRISVTGSAGYDGTVYSSSSARIATAAAVSSATEMTASTTAGDKHAVSVAKFSLVEGYYFTLPVPTREHYVFLGWYAGDNRITDGNGASLAPASGTYALTAHYEEKGKVTVRTSSFVDGASSFVGSTEYYIEDGSVYLTAETIGDHECVAWESVFRYTVQSEKPEDWDACYNRYYVRKNGAYVLNTDKNWSSTAVYAYPELSGRFVTEKPEDWDEAFNRYYTINFEKNATPFAYGLIRYSLKYVPVTTKPSNWATTYSSYYALRDGKYYKNSSSTWGVEDMFSPKYVVLDTLPTDWETSYESYYNATFSRNESAEWSENKYYYDFRVNDVGNPSALTVLLTGLKADTELDFTAVYREAYRVSISGGTGSGYYVAEDEIDLSAIVTAGRTFEKWSFTKDDKTYSLATTDDALCLVTENDAKKTVVISSVNGTLSTSDFYVHNASDVFTVGKIYQKQYVLLDACPSDWDTAYAFYFVLSAGDYLPNDSSEWRADTYYVETYSIVKEEPANWATNYASYYTSSVSYLANDATFRLSDVKDLGVSITGGCNLKAAFIQIDYVLRYELNLNVNGNRISTDDPSVAAYLNSIGFFDNDDGVFVYDQLLHYNQTIPWIELQDVRHYLFNGWRSVSGDRPVTMPRLDDGEIYTVVGNYSPEKMTITVTSDSHGTAKIGSSTGVDSGKYGYGEVIRIFVTAYSGYEFDKWTYGEGQVLEVNHSIIGTFADEDKTDETVIYYFTYRISGDANDDDKNIRCTFRERAYDIIYRISYSYDGENVTGDERFNKNFVPITQNGLSYDIEVTNEQYYRVYYTTGGQLSVDKLNAAMKFAGILYTYNGDTNGSNINFGSAETVFVNNVQYYRLPVVSESGEEKAILCYTFASSEKLDYLTEISKTYKSGLIGTMGYAVTATTQATYGKTARIFDAPSASDLNLPFAAYWSFSKWKANYNEAQLSPTSFTMPDQTVIVTATYTAYTYSLTLAMGGTKGLSLSYVTVNDRDPLYYVPEAERENGIPDTIVIPYDSKVVAEYKISTGYAFTDISYVNKNKETVYPAHTKSYAKKADGSNDLYDYIITFDFTAGENIIYEFGLRQLSYTLTSYLRVDRENESSISYLYGPYGLGLDLTSTRVIENETYYLYRIIDTMTFGYSLSTAMGDLTPQASLLNACYYNEFRNPYSAWQYFTEEDGAYSESTMPDTNLFTYATLKIKTYTVTVPTDEEYDFDEGIDTGVYLMSTPVDVGADTYDYYTAFDLSYILPHGYHHVNWKLTGQTGTSTILTEASFFRRTYTRLNSRPADWGDTYKNYYVVDTEKGTGKFVKNASNEWNENILYYELTGISSVYERPAEYVRRDDLYGFYTYTKNTDSVWRPTEKDFYAEKVYIRAETKPSDWDKNYASFFFLSGSDYVPNDSAVWDDGKEYYFVGLSAFIQQPSSWSTDYKQYYKVSVSNYLYTMTKNTYVGEYYYYVLETITNKPADWESAYWTYYIEDNGLFVKNALVEWDDDAVYAKQVSYQSVLGTPADVESNSARYGKYIRIPNTGKVWEADAVYVQERYAPLTEKPADWDEKYAAYYILDGTVYLPNVSSTWDTSAIYAYLEYVSLQEMPNDWDTNYKNYQKLVSAPYWYEIGKEVVMTDLRLYISSNVRIEANFAKDIFTVTVVSSETGVVSTGQEGTSENNYNSTVSNFEYGSNLGIKILGGVSDGKKIDSLSIYHVKADGTPFNESSYAEQFSEKIVPPVDPDNYEYLQERFTTEKAYTGHVYLFVKINNIQYHITYELYTQVTSLNTDISEDHKITLTWTDDVNREDPTDLGNRFRIGYGDTFRLSDFLSSDETLGLLTADQLESTGAGVTSNLLVVNWFTSKPTAHTTQSNILNSYFHQTKDGNLTVYGILMNMFCLEITNEYTCLGFNPEITTSFPSVYERNISELILPSSIYGSTVTRYGYTKNGKEYYFRNNVRLKTVDCGSNVTYISAGAFKGCSELTNVTFSSNLHTVDNEAFADCTKLNNVTFPSSLTVIGNLAFSNTHITSVTIDNSGRGRSFGARVFADNPYLETVYFDCNSNPGDVSNRTTTIDQSGLFQGSGSLATNGITLYVGPNASYINNTLFGYDYAGSQSNNGTYLKYVVIETSTGAALVQIPQGAFRNTALVNITLNARVSSLAEDAFRSCAYLVNVTFTEDCPIESIPNNCFFTCTALQSVVLPVTVKTIGVNAFAGTSALTGVYYRTYNDNSSGLKTLENNAFAAGYIGSTAHRCGLRRFMPYSLRDQVADEVIIPASVTTIGSSCFNGCGITRLILNSTSLSIRSQAFYDLSVRSGNQYVSSLSYFEYNVGTVTPDIPEGEELDLFALADTTTPMENCEVVIGNDTTTLPKEFFKDMTAAQILRIGSHLSQLGKSVFAGMTGLTDIYFNASNLLASPTAPHSDEFFAGSGCGNATVHFGADVSVIPAYLFNKASGISTLLFTEGSSVTINDYAFNGTAVSSLTFPEMTNLTLNASALLGANLTSLTIDENTPVTIGVGAISSSRFNTLSIPGISITDQSLPIQIDEGTLTITPSSGANVFTLPAQSAMTIRAMGSAKAFSISRGDTFNIYGAVTINNDFYVYGSAFLVGGATVYNTQNKKIYGGVYSESDFTEKNTSSFFTDLLLSENIQTSYAWNFTGKTYTLSQNKTLTVSVGTGLTVSSAFICNGTVSVQGNMKTSSLANVTLPSSGKIIVAAKSGFAIGSKLYFAEQERYIYGENNSAAKTGYALLNAKDLNFRFTQANALLEPLGYQTVETGNTQTENADFISDFTLETVTLGAKSYYRLPIKPLSGAFDNVPSYVLLYYGGNNELADNSLTLLTPDTNAESEYSGDWTFTLNETHFFGQGIYIANGNVEIASKVSTGVLTSGMDMMLSGSATTENTFTFNNGDVFTVPAGSTFTVDHDVTIERMNAIGTVNVNASLTVLQQNAVLHIGDTSYADFSSVSDATTYFTEGILSFNITVDHACGTEIAVFVYGMTSKIRDINDQLKTLPVDTKYLYVCTPGESDLLVSDAAKTARGIYNDRTNRFAKLLPLHTCTYDGNTATVDEEVIGYLMIDYNAAVVNGYFICNNCRQSEVLTSASITTAEHKPLLSVAATPSLLQDATAHKPYVVGYTASTTIGDLNDYISSLGYALNLSAASYSSTTLISNVVNDYPVFEDERTYCSLPLKLIGQATTIGYLALSSDVTYDGSIVAEIKTLSGQNVVYYGDLSYALAQAAADSTLLLLKDCSSASIVITKNVTLDTYGHTLTMTGSSGSSLVTVGNGTSSPSVTFTGTMTTAVNGTLFDVAYGTLNVTGSILSTANGQLFTHSGSSLSIINSILTANKLLTASSDVTLDNVDFIGAQGAEISGGTFSMLNSVITADGSALLLSGNANATVSNTLRDGILSTQTDTAVTITTSGAVTINGTSTHHMQIVGVNVGILIKRGTLTLSRYVDVISTEERKNDLSSMNGALVIAEEDQTYNITVSINDSNIVFINGGADHDAILHVNATDAKPTLQFNAKPVVSGTFTELTTYNGLKTNSDGIYSKSSFYSLPIYSRLLANDTYAYLVYSETLDQAIQPSYSPVTDNVWDDAHYYASKNRRNLVNKPADWESNYTNYYYYSGSELVRNSSPEFRNGTVYYYYVYNELTAKPLDWDSNYNTYFIMDAKTTYSYPVASNEWDDGKEYYNAQMERIAEKPADWDENYQSYLVKTAGKTYVYSTGDIEATKSLVIPENCVLLLSNTLNFNYSGISLVVCGEIETSSGILCSETATIRIKKNGRLLFTSSSGKIGQKATIVIEGTLALDDSTLNVEVGTSFTCAETSVVNVSAQSALNVVSGEITFGGELNVNGVFSVAEGATATIGSTATVHADGAFTSFGTLSVAGAIIATNSFTSSGSLLVTGSISLDSDDSDVKLTVNKNADFKGALTVENSAQFVVGGNGTKVTFYPDSSFAVSTMLCSGTLLILTDTVSLTAGSIAVGATFIVPSASYSAFDGVLTYSTGNNYYYKLEEEPSDWSTNYASYYLSPGVPLTEACAWVANSYYYNVLTKCTLADVTVTLRENWTDTSSVVVTACNYYNMRSQKMVVANTCEHLGYTYSVYNNTMNVNDENFNFSFIFANPGIIHWEISTTLLPHDYMPVSIYNPGFYHTDVEDTRHRVVCKVCETLKGQLEHEYSGFSLSETQVNVTVNGEGSSRTMLLRDCAYCNASILATYFCEYNTTLADINNYLDGKYYCKFASAPTTDLIYDHLAGLGTTSDYDSNQYYLCPVTDGDNNGYILIYYDYSYEWQIVADSNLHMKEWNNGFFSYGVHTFSSVTTKYILKNYSNYFIKSGNNYVQNTSIVRNSASNYYYNRSTSASYTSSCYVYDSENDCYVPATGSEVDATYYKFTATTINANTTNCYQVLTGVCSVCGKSFDADNRFIYFRYDNNTTYAQLNAYLSGSGYQASSASTRLSTVTTTYSFGGNTYYMLTVRKGSTSYYVFGIKETDHEYYYDWNNYEDTTHSGFCESCPAATNSGSHNFNVDPSTLGDAKMFSCNIVKPGKEKRVNIFTVQCQDCGNYHVYFANIFDNDTFSKLGDILSASGYSIVYSSYTSSDKISEHTEALAAYERVGENRYLVPIRKNDETGFVVISLEHDYVITYSDIDYHKKACSGCSDTRYEKHVGSGTLITNTTLVPGYTILGYTCTVCGEFIPCHYQTDHFTTISGLNTSLSNDYGVTLACGGAATYLYQIIADGSLNTAEFMMSLDRGATADLYDHYLVPVTYQSETRYVAVYFKPHTLEYSPDGPLVFDGMLSKKHIVSCDGCDYTYTEDHVFDDTYVLVLNSDMNYKILCQVCTRCHQAVAVMPTFEDNTPYSTLSTMIGSYIYYKELGSPIEDDTLVSIGMFYNRNGIGYNPGYDIDEDGFIDYYGVELTTTDNENEVLGYILVKFLHHMEFMYMTTEGEDVLVCNVCQYRETTHHVVAKDPYAVEFYDTTERVTKQFNYDVPGNISFPNISLDDLLGYNVNNETRLLIFYFGPDTTVDDATKYFIGAIEFNNTFWRESAEDGVWHFDYETKGYICGDTFTNSEPLKEYLDSNDFKKAYKDGVLYYRLPMYYAECDFGYQNGLFSGEVTSEINTTNDPDYNLLVAFDKNAPKDGYFRLFDNDSPIDFTSYADLAMGNVLRGISESDYGSPSQSVTIDGVDGKSFSAINHLTEQTQLTDPIVYLFNDETTMAQITQYFLGLNNWTIDPQQITSAVTSIMGEWENENGNKKFYCFPVRASGYLASTSVEDDDTNALTDTALVKDGAWETCVYDGITYYIIPLYRHTDSTIYFDSNGRYLRSESELSSVENNPAIYILARKDNSVTSDGRFILHKGEEDLKLFSYQIKNISGLVSNKFIPTKAEKTDLSSLKEFFLGTTINSDTGTLIYNIGYETTLADFDNAFEELTFFYDGYLNIIDPSTKLSTLIASYLYDTYYVYSRSQSQDHFYIPVARVSSPYLRIGNIRLNFMGMLATSHEDSMVQTNYGSDKRVNNYSVIHSADIYPYGMIELVYPIAVDFCDDNAFYSLVDGSVNKDYDLQISSSGEITNASVSAFNSLGQAYVSLIGKYNLTDTEQVFVATSSNATRTAYTSFFSSIKNLFDAAYTSERNLGYAVSDGVLFGLTSPYVLSYNGCSMDSDDLLTIVSRLFGYEDEAEFSARVALVANVLTENELGASSSKRLAYNGSVYTDSGAFILPFIAHNSISVSVLMCVFVYDGVLSVWVSDADVASKVVIYEDIEHNGITPKYCKEDSFVLTSDNITLKNYCECDVLTYLLNNGGNTACLIKNTGADIAPETILHIDAMSDSYSDLMTAYAAAGSPASWQPAAGSNANAFATNIFDESSLLRDIIRRRKVFGKSYDIRQLLDYEMTDTVILGISHNHIISFGTISYTYAEMMSVIRLFGYTDQSAFVNNVALLATQYSQNAAGVDDAIIKNRLLYEGAIYTTNGTFVLPYIFLDAKNHAAVIAYLFIESNGNASIWFSSATTAVRAATNDTTGNKDVYVYGRCHIFDYEVDYSKTTISLDGRSTLFETRQFLHDNAYDALVLGAICSLCNQKEEYIPIKVDATTTLAALYEYVTIIKFMIRQGQIGSDNVFIPADWYALTKTDGMYALLNDPSVQKDDRLYNQLDTMIYGQTGQKKTVNLLNIGATIIDVPDEVEEGEPVTSHKEMRNIYLALDVEDLG